MSTQIILISFKQLSYFGVHIGHSINNYVFLSSWIFFGWHKNIFIINLYKTFLNLRFAIDLFCNVSSMCRPIMFVCIRSAFGPLVARYGYVCGEGFNIYWWIFGTLTNFRRMVNWNSILARLMMRNQMKLRYKDKKRLASFIGLTMARRRPPAAGFVPSVLDNLGPVDEFLTARIPCVGIIDSNVPSWNVLLPVPGNDDSFICINFYCYLFARTILAGKIDLLAGWRFSVWQRTNWKFFPKYRHVRYPKKYRNAANFIYLYSNLYRNFDKKSFFENFENMRRAVFPLNNSVANFINYWAQDSGIVTDFSAYEHRKGFYVNLFENEMSSADRFKMHFTLN